MQIGDKTVGAILKLYNLVTSFCVLFPLVQVLDVIYS
jgi:hypothetical protein